MRRPTLITLAVSLVLVSCGGDDDSTTPTPDESSTETTSAITDPPPPTAPLVSQECADEPDPSVYQEGALPPLIPACSVPSELVIHRLRDGIGNPAESGDMIIVDYAGMIIGTGEVFDASYIQRVPLDFPLGLGAVIEGWDSGLIGARAGELLRLDIPSDLAYGDAPPGDQIQAGDALSFNVEVRAIVPSVAAEDAPLDVEVAPSEGATELSVTELVRGDGPSVELGDTAIVHMLLVRGDNQVILFNSWERDDALQIVMNDGTTLPGIFDGLQGATVGSRLVLAMPPDLAFGTDGEPSLGLPAGVDLIVVLDVVGVY